MAVLKKLYSFLRDILIVFDESKKAKALFAGLVVTLVGKIGFNISDETVYAVLGFLGSYIIGQGLADKGKEAVRMQVSELKKERDKLVEASDEYEGSAPIIVVSPVDPKDMS